MVTQEKRTAAATGAPGGDSGRRVRISRVTPAGAATAAGAGLGSLALVWVLYERVLPFSGVLGFALSWYVVFLVLYGAMAWLQWDRRETTQRVTTVVFTTVGVVTLAVVVSMALYVLLRGFSAIRHLNFWYQSMASAGPLSPLSDGGIVQAIVGTAEQIALATLFSVPLAVAAALFLAEVGGPLAVPVRVIVEAMTALPDIIAGLFIYALWLLTFGFGKSGLAASLALTVTMMPIIARACEVVLRLVPGTLREASYALGSSQWRTVWNVLLPTVRSGLATAVVLGMARGIGETAPVLVVSGVTSHVNFNPVQGPQVSLPLFIWTFVHVLGTTPGYIARGFGAGFALVLVVLLLFGIARWIGGSAPGELTRGQRRRLAREAYRG